MLVALLVWAGLTTVAPLFISASLALAADSVIAVLTASIIVIVIYSFGVGTESNEAAFREHF
jgi:hypothetical protein